MRRFIVVGVLYFFLVAVSTYAQSLHAVQSQYRFKHITVDQGLSNNSVWSICQDSKGFIWIATQNGADKFDGQTIVSYRYDPQDSSTLSSNSINTIFLDSKNNLWIGTNKGLDLYNRDFDNFIRFAHKDIDLPLEDVETVVEDKVGKLWIGAFAGIYAYDLNTSELQFFGNEEGNAHGIPSNRIYNLLVDRNNNVWISVLNEGLGVYDQKDETFRFFIHDPEDPSTISGNRIECLYEDSIGNIWAGTLNNGLNLYVPESNTFIRTIPDPDNNYSTRVRAIFEDLKGNFFVGTRAGLYLRNNYTNEFVHYAYEGHKFSNLSQSSILGSFIDKTGTLWLGTFSGGVNYTDLNKKEFIHFSAGTDDNHFLSGANIYAIAEDPKGNLWVGGDNGLNYLDRTTHTFTYYFNDPEDPASISYNDIKALAWDKSGNLWIGTNRGGLNYYNVETGKFKSFRHDPNNSNSLAGDKIYGLLNDKENNLWIILNTDNDFQALNIDYLPNGSEKFIHLNEKSHYGFEQSENGDVYIGGLDGFWIFSRRDSIFNFISNDTLIGIVNTIRKDSKNKLWIGSDKGLVRYDEEDGSFERFSEENGYPISEVFGILEDNSKTLWVSTNSGLVKITNIVEDIKDLKIRVFDSKDGLQSKQFNYNAYLKCMSGEMVFGGVNGFNTFFPENIVENHVPPYVILTDLKIYNTSTPIGEKVGGRLILKKSISVTDEIELGKKQNVFTLEFASLHNAHPETSTYKYKLENFDSEWQFRKAGSNFATYTNLPAGKYTFLVTAANNDGVWNEEPLKLGITVVPPFSRTWWFRGILVLLIAIIISALYIFRVSSLKEQKIKLEQKVSRRTEELKKAYDNIRITSEFGQKITSTLDVDSINEMIYNYIKSFISTFTFGIGMYVPDENVIEYRVFDQDGKLIAPIKRSLSSTNSFTVLCFNTQRTIVVNDVKNEYHNYLAKEPEFSIPHSPNSILNIPLTVYEKKIGVLAINSLERNAFGESDLLKLQTLAAYIAIALDNASSHTALKDKNSLLIERQKKIEEQSEQLNDTNALLEERQQHIEEQTEELQAQSEKLHIANDELQNSNATKDKLFSIIAHDIKNPFSSVLGFSELIISRWGNLDSSKMKRMVKAIHSSSENIYNLLENLLQWSRSQMGNIRLKRENISLHEIVKDNVELLSEIMTQKNNTAHIKIPGDLYCYADVQTLKTVIRNILTNANKFTDNGTITIISKIENDVVKTIVQDSGVGIAQNKLKTLFEVEKSKSTEGTKGEMGTGLGLIICKEFIIKNGGKIYAESEPNKGTSIIFTLPLSKPS